jgi:hypothetical protein
MRPLGWFRERARVEVTGWEVSGVSAIHGGGQDMTAGVVNGEEGEDVGGCYGGEQTGDWRVMAQLEASDKRVVAEGGVGSWLEPVDCGETGAALQRHFPGINHKRSAPTL